MADAVEKADCARCLLLLIAALTACATSAGAPASGEDDGWEQGDGGGAGGQGGTGVGSEGLAARGEYLVRHVLRCPDCHSRRADGGATGDGLLAGDPCSIDSDAPADNGRGCLPAPNLTNHPTGLQLWTDGDIEAALREGRSREGRQLAAQMPYFQFRVLEGRDMQAVIAFLRSVPGVDHVVGRPQPPHDRSFAAVPPLALDDLPLPNGDAAATRGRYLTAVACYGCHTPPAGAAPGPVASPFDLSRAFAGGRSVLVGATDASPSANLTSDATGLAGWTVDDVSRALVAGVDRNGASLCAPMPSGPDGAFAGLLESDRRDIAAYLLALPPLENHVQPFCR